MLDILNSLLNTFITVISFFINSIESLISLITRIPGYVMMIINSVNILPQFLIPYVLAFIGIVVLQYVLNRKAS